MSRFLHPLLAVLLFATGMPAVSAHAADVPSRKSGLWSLKSSGVGGMTMETQVCSDPAKERSDSIVSSGPRKCKTPPQYTRVPGGFSFHTVCDVERGMTVDSRGTVLGDFQSAYTVKVTTSISPAPAGMGPMTMTMSARYLGACPAGMQPGDVKANGRIIHPH